MQTVIACVLLSVIAACTAHPAAESTERTAEPIAKASGPVIATIATNDRKVSILGGAKNGESLRVVVRDAQGTVTADGITVEELRRTDPLLGILVTNAVAKNGVGEDGSYLDATLDRPVRRAR